MTLVEAEFSYPLYFCYFNAQLHPVDQINPSGWINASIASTGQANIFEFMKLVSPGLKETWMRTLVMDKYLFL